MSQPVSQMTLEALRSVPLFASLDDSAATELRNLLSDKIVPRNTRLFRQGDTGDGMYLIESGRVRISLRDDDKQELTLAELALRLSKMHASRFSRATRFSLSSALIQMSH